jgi:hypothetical protein
VDLADHTTMNSSYDTTSGMAALHPTLSSTKSTGLVTHPLEAVKILGNSFFTQDSIPQGGSD